MLCNYAFYIEGQFCTPEVSGSNPTQGEFSSDQAESLTYDTLLVSDQCLQKSFFDTNKNW